MTQDVTKKICRKCQGTGYLAHFAHNDGGRCWSCDAAYGPRPEPTADELEADEIFRRVQAAKLWFGPVVFRRLRKELVAR